MKMMTNQSNTRRTNHQKKRLSGQCVVEVSFLRSKLEVVAVAEQGVDRNLTQRVNKVTRRTSQAKKTRRRVSGTSTALSARMVVTFCAVKGAIKLRMSAA